MSWQRGPLYWANQANGFSRLLSTPLQMDLRCHLLIMFTTATQAIMWIGSTNKIDSTNNALHGSNSVVHEGVCSPGVRWSAWRFDLCFCMKLIFPRFGYYSCLENKKSTRPLARATGVFHSSTIVVLYIPLYSRSLYVHHKYTGFGIQSFSPRS